MRLHSIGNIGTATWLLISGFITVSIGLVVLWQYDNRNVASAEFVEEVCQHGNWPIPGIVALGSLERLSEMSDAIVRGRISDRRIETGDEVYGEERMWAVHDVEVIEVFKGSIDSEVITVGELFGCFEASGEYFLFLSLPSNGKSAVDRPDKYDNPGVYASHWTTEFLVRDSGVTPRDPGLVGGRSNISVEELEAQIREAVSAD